MALIDIKVPQLSESVAEATLLQWKRQPGDAIAQDEILIDIETDKVVMEIPAPAAGVLAEVLSPNGSTVLAGEVIARMDTTPQATTTGIPMPAAARLMADHGLAVGTVQGTGKNGRITKGDVLSAMAASHSIADRAVSESKKPVFLTTSETVLETAPNPESRPLPTVGGTPTPDTDQRVPMNRLRARIAERMVWSQSHTATLTTFNEVNMAPVLDLRRRLQESFQEEHGIKLGLMSFFVKAVVHTLQKFPILNASVDGDDIVYHNRYDIGIAVGSPRGLVVPVLRHADQLRIGDIEKRIAEFATLAQTGKLEIEDLTGGTFSITNGGVFGSMMSTPILNPPQSAILGIHATKDRAVVENGQIVVRPMNYFALSYDHRIIDGREAVLGLVAIKQALEDPVRLLLGI